MLGNKYVAAFVAVLLSLVIAYNIQFFLKKSRPGNPVPAGQGKKSSGKPLQQGSARQLPAAKPSEGRDAGAWKRDPFSLQAAAQPRQAAPVEDIKLTGIIKRNGRSHALINGRVYGLHDRIGKTEILNIERHSITVLSEGKKREISFDAYNDLKEKKK